MATIRSLANKVSADAKKNRESASNKKRQERLQNVTLSSNTAITSAIEKLNETAKPSAVSANLSGEAWTRATASQTVVPQDKQKNFTESQLKTYQAQMDQATRDANDWSIREEMEFLGSGSLVPQDVLDRTNKSIYKSSAEANRAAQIFGQQKTSLLNQNYENRSQDILKTVNADKNASSALKTAQGLEDLQRQIRYELEWSSAEGIDRSSAETRKLGLQYGLTEAECKNIWSMQAAITKKLKRARAAVERTGVSYDDAYEYLRRQELSQEAANKKTALEKELDDNGLEMAKHTGLSVLANMGKGVDYVAGIAGNWGHNDERNLDTYRPMNSNAMSAANYVNTVRGKVGSEIQEGATAGLKKLGASEGVAQFGGEASKFLYDTGMSIVDNAAQMAVAGVAGAGTAGTSAIVSGFMGTGAAADQMKNILDNGGTNSQAIAGGLAAGVAEALFEKVSIDALLSPKNVTNFKSWAKEALKQGGVEASEEVCTELANMFTDALIRGQDSDFQRAIAYYQTEEGGGLSLAEAKKKAYLDAIGQVALAGLGGFISGGVMQGVKGGVGLGNYNSALKKVGQAVKDSTGNTQNTSHIAEIQKGLAAAEGSKARQLAEQAQKELDSKKTVPNKMLGKLAVENQNELREAMKTASPEAAAKAMTELSLTGNVSTATMAELRASAKVSPAASAEVQQTEVQAQVTQAENPGVKVLDAATTLFTQQGMQLKTAQKKAQIVQDLIDGKDVDVDQIKNLEPTNPKARALFTQLTGVQFPEGKMTQEQLYSLYRSAHDVAVQAQTEAVAIDSTEGRETFPGINRVLDNSGQETPVNQMSEEQILEQAKTVRETANPEADARAAQALAQMRGEIAPDGNALLSFKEFSDFIKQQNPKATREETARLYDQYLKDNQTVEFRGQRLSHMQFMDMVRHAPRGSELTEAEAESLWAAEVDRQRGAGEEKYSVSESQRTKESEMNAAAEQARRAENAATAKWMQDVLKPIGVQQVIVEYGTMGDNENAYIDSDGILHFNGDRMSGANAMIWTLGHELVHHAEFRTGETGNVSEDIIDAFSKLNKAGALSGVAKTWMDNVDGRVSEIKKTYQDHEASLENGDPDKVTDAYCREELAGDLMRIAFTEDNLLMRLAGEKPSLLIRSKEALARLKAQMFGNEQIRATVDARKALDEMEKRFEKALKTSEARAIRNEPGAFTDSDGNLIVENDGKGSSRMSLSTYEESGKEILRTWLDDAVDNKQLSREDADDILNSLDTIYQVCKGYKDQYAPFSAWSDAKVVTDSNGNPVFSVVKANGEYSMNLDFSLVCKKRRTLDAVLNEMVRRGLADNVNMGQENIVRINDIIRKYGFEAACSLCFVDAKRFRQAKVADDFVKMYNDQVNSLIPKGSDLKASYFNFGGNSLIDNTGRGIESLSDTDLDFTKVDKILKTKGERTVEYKIAKHLKENAADRRLCARSDFLSTRGFNVVKKENPAVMSLFNSKKGSGGPKSAESDVQYLNEILASKTFDPEKAYAVGGVRIQSFSDFVPRMVFDYVQMFADMSAKQLPGHAYTKEELFVKMFGLTGLKINMSLIPKVVDGGVAAGLDADGNYVWADESFDYDIALEIQSADGYSKNCGTIAVGVSDEHIRKLLADPNIRMVIPYHKSGLNPEVARMNKIDQFTDYTDSQNTRHKNGNKLDKDNAADKKLLAEETNFNQRLHEMGENGDPQAVVEEYVKWCEDNDLLPKFDQFVYKKIGDMFVEEDGHKVVDENYYKLIEDFTVYDGGTYSPQTAVKMTFPTEDSAFGPMSELIKRGLEEDAILEGMRSEKVGPIVDEIAQAMQSNEWKSAAEEPGKKRSRKRYSVEEENDATDDSGMAFYDTEKKYSVLVEDKDTLDFLNNQKTIKTYKTMQLVAGKLYPPMASRINGKFEDASELGKWEQATEHPELIKNGNKFKLDKGKGNGSIEAAYNPYMHSSNLVINDQFTGAYTRDNLVTVECEVPVSEVTSGYHAEYAKDSVGWHSWHTGTVAGQIRKEKGIERQVFLSRWIKPVRIVPDSEVASMYKTLLDGTDIAVPDNVVTPSLRNELQKAGVKLQESGRVRYSITGENDAVENEKAIRKLENEIEDINAKLDLASVDGLSEIEVRRLQNQLTKIQYELDQRNAAERKAAVRTPLQTVLDNLDNYRAIDLESIANQLTDNAWDDVETLSTEELKSGIREILQERAGDLSPLEMQSPKFGVYVRKPSTSAGVRYSITPEFEQWYLEGFTDQNDRDRVKQEIEDLRTKYGTIPAGENPTREANLPRKIDEKTRVHDTARTVMEAEATPEKRLADIQKAVLDGKLADVPVKNDVVSRRARARVEKNGWQTSLTDWTAKVRAGETSADLVAEGAVLLNNAGNSDMSGEQYVELLTDYSNLMHRTGQSLQAARILKTLSPEGRLYGIQKTVDLLNDNNWTKAEKKKGFDPAAWAEQNEIKLDPALVDAYRNAKTDTERDFLLGQIQQNIADQMPASLAEKLNNWRYLAMLGNFRTQIRNVLGNFFFQIPREVKETVAGGIEGALEKAGVKIDRTRSVVRDNATYKAAMKDFDSVRDIILSGGKVNEKMSYLNGIDSKRRIYKNKVLEGYRRVVNTAMDSGDAVFCKFTYADSLARFMAANHTTWDAAPETLREKGRLLAIKEAAEATYRDNNAFSEMVLSMRFKNPGSNKAKKAVNAVVEGILPFRKTPANILVRGVEYSPLGLVKTAVDTVSAAKGSRNVTGSDLVNEFAKSLTGSGLFALGYFLTKLGVLTALGPDDDDKEKEFWELQGNQSYSINLFGRSYTIDWLAPEAIPLLVGANTAEIAADEGLDLNAVTKAATRITDPMLEMSMLQGVNSLIENISNTKTVAALPSLVLNSLWSYGLQYVPTLTGQLNRAMDNTRRTTYTDATSGVPTGVQYSLGKLSQKVPGWSYNQIPYIDQWGRMEENYESKLGNAFAQFLSPAYQSIPETSDMERELRRLYDATGETGVLPSKAPKYLTVDGERRDLTAEEYVNYATLRGQTAYDMLTDLTGSSVYRKMSDKDKVKAVGEIYSYAADLAKQDLLGGETKGTTQKAVNADSYGISSAEYAALKTQTSGIESLKYKNQTDADGKPKTIQNSQGLQIMESVYSAYPNLTKKQYEALFEALGVGKTVRGYGKQMVQNKLKQMRRQAAK